MRYRRRLAVQFDAFALTPLGELGDTRDRKERSRLLRRWAVVVTRSSSRAPGGTVGSSASPTSGASGCRGKPGFHCSGV